MNFVFTTPSQHLQKVLLAVDSAGGVVRVSDEKHSQPFSSSVLILISSSLQLLAVWLFGS